MDASRSEAGDRGSFSSWQVILGFLTIFKKYQASSTFEALNSACLSSCQRDLRLLVEMRWKPRTFSRVRGFRHPFIL